MNQKSTLSSGVVLLQRINNAKLRQARTLRKNMTEAEKVLWEHLRNRRLAGLKFRRQQIIEGYVVDFFCHELKLVVETDGEIHNTPEQKEKDKKRRNTFNSRGLKEIRFKNREVLNNISTVLDKIKSYKTK